MGDPIPSGQAPWRTRPAPARPGPARLWAVDVCAPEAGRRPWLADCEASSIQTPTAHLTYSVTF